MSRKKLAFLSSLVIAVAAIAGGIAYAQESAPVALLEEQDQEPAVRTFSWDFNGGTYLGVRTEDISKENMGRYGLREVRGVGVTEVIKDSPAEKAGLRKDDVIVRFEGESVTSVRKLTRLVSESSPDQTVRLTISRGGAEQEMTVTLSKQSLNGAWRTGIRDEVFRGIEKSFPKIQLGGNLGDGDFTFIFANRRIGVSTQSLTKQLAEYFGVEGGVLVTAVTENSPAAKAGLKAGDIITAVDGEKISSPGDITRMLGKKDTGDVSLTVVRDRSTRTVTVTPEKGQHPTLIRPGNAGTRTITVPAIEIPVVPAINVTVPAITIPSTPPINVTVPRRVPRVITSKSGVII
jgi:serine protease Do